MANKSSKDNGERLPQLALETTESTAFGRGWISGILSAVLGIVGLGAVLCFRFPGVLTIPELLERYQYVEPYIRGTLHVVLVTSLMIQIITLLTLNPVMVFLEWARLPFFAQHESAAWLVLQIPLCLLVADFAQYWIHRTFHAVPFLWRFHAIHHSAEAMDWLAGARLHLVDVVVTRGLTYVPLYVLGFSETTIAVYVIVVAVQATFIHANVRWEFRWIRRLIATPCFHHWHHAAEPQAVDKNFSVHSTLWDWLFGTYYMPGRWPNKYGLCDERDVPSSWLLQFVYPFYRRDDSVQRSTN